MASNTAFQRIWLPGFLFQSVIIGGGYATGRELVEFFLTAGPLGGLLGMTTAALGFSLITAISFEVARRFHSYNYRSFFQRLLGRGWFLFEIAYLILAVLVLAVIGAAAGEIVKQHLGMAGTVGTVSLMVLIGVLVFWGTALIERVFAGWSFVLYATYAVIVLAVLFQHGDRLPAAFAVESGGWSWLGGSLKYVGYSMAVVPMILFCARHMETRKDALLAGALSGPIAMLPAALFYLAMVTSYPQILQEPVPADYIMRELQWPMIQTVFYVVIFGTFVETGTACIHAVNERISAVYQEKKQLMPRWLRPGVAAVALVVSIFLAGKMGVIDLIARGYGTLSWAFLAIYLVPLLTIGVYLILRKERVAPGTLHQATADEGTTIKRGN